MHIEELLNVDRITVNMAVGDRADAINALADSFANSSPRLSRAQVARALQAREDIASTNVGSGVAIPHARLPNVDGASVAITICRDAVVFGPDGSESEPVRILVGLLTREGEPCASLSALSAVATLLRSEDVREQLRQAQTPSRVLEVLTAAHNASPCRTWRAPCA